MYDYLALMFDTDMPIPPADFDILAACVRVSYIPEIESSLTINKKQDDICGEGVPALKRVGVAWVKNFFDIRL